ncbi:MAG: beta-ketoacyl synthase N-terminal-like domain-containing protein [Gemmatimonadaceae bacterium]
MRDAPVKVSSGSRAKPSVIVRGMGLSCALGIGVEACFSRLQQGAVAPIPWTISNLGDTFTAPVYAVPGTPPLDMPGRAVALIEGAVREAIHSSGLTQNEIAALPLFIGTSAFSLDRDATRVNIDESTAAIGVQPVIAHQQITLIVQRLLGNSGQSFAFQTACTSSANAVLSAARMIELGWYQHALVVGVELANLATIAGFSSLQLIAAELKPFDKNRQGIVLGEGVGAVVLSAAPRENAGMHIRAGGTNIDTYRVTMSNPDGVTIADLQRLVLHRSGIAASEILGIKAHGTGSPMNDSGEAAVIHRVFPNPPPVCALKGYLGHTLGACGVNELVVMAAALRAGVFPATPGFNEVDPELNIAPTRKSSVAKDGLYLLNYFGFGGHNTVMIVEQRS